MTRLCIFVVVIQENVSLKQHTTFQVGGMARWYAAPSTVEEISDVLRWRAQQNLPLFVLGRGSNLVISDKGWPGLILHLGASFSGIAIDDTLMTTESGALLHTAVTKAVRAGLAGIENLAGIPGTMGGGAYINAGAFDQELCQVIEEVISMTPSGEIHRRNNAECGFAYRHSAFFGLDEIILEVKMRLQQADPQVLHAQMQAILAKRKDKQPLAQPNAGSMFKRPPGTYAGLLIEQSGLKGLQVGQAQVSSKHANFLVNLGGATAQDVWDLSSQVIAIVQKDHGIRLEREVIFLGDFGT